MTALRRIILPLLLLTFLSGLAAGFWVPRDDVFFAIKKNFTIFGKLYEEISVGYVDPVDPEKLMRVGVEAMLRTLDPYTVFIDEADHQDIDLLMRGRYGGVGLSIGIRNGRVMVIMPIEGYSGHEQGIRPGDIITHVENTPVDGLSAENVSALLRGDPGTTLHLHIDREGEPGPLEFVLRRAEVRLKNVTYSGIVENGVGYVRLERFSREAGQEVQQAIQSMMASDELNGLVLDLRDNPGGLLDAAVEVVELFVPRGSVIVSTRGRQPQTERVYRSSRSPLVPDLPLVVLVNGNSASASEIVAGAVQDLDRGVVLGDRTFGKGLVQIIKPLPYNTSLKMTTSKYYTPSGRCIQSIAYTHDEADGYAVEVADSLRQSFTTTRGRTVKDGGGIEPDITISVDDTSELELALLRRSSFFLYANHYAAGNPPATEQFQVSDEVLSGFQDWLSGQNFTYRTRAERALDAFREDLEKAGYQEALSETRGFQAQLAAEKEQDFSRYAERLREQLRMEIVSRFHGETAQIQASLPADLQLQRALSLLKDHTEYRSVLAMN